MSDLIIRPGMRALTWQLVAGASVATASGLAWWFFASHRTWMLGSGLIGVAFLASAAFHLAWLRGHAPRAIVATASELAILEHHGEHRTLPWSTVTAATHATEPVGICWE